MFSSITIALSTSMPTAKARPPRAGTLSERPIRAMTMKAPIVLIRMCMKMMTVERALRRKTRSVAKVKRLPQSRLSRTRLTEEVM